MQEKSTSGVVSRANFQAEVLQSNLPVLVVFWARWSHPCKILNVVLEEVAATHTGQLKLVRINADDNPDLSLVYEVQSIPTLLYFVKGELKGRIVGTASKEAVLSKLQLVTISNSASAASNPASK